MIENVVPCDSFPGRSEAGVFVGRRERINEETPGEADLITSGKDAESVRGEPSSTVETFSAGFKLRPVLLHLL